MTSSSAAATLHYTHHLNPRVAVCVARHLNAPVDCVRSSPRDPAHEPAFRKINPNALCPILVEPGRTTWETDAVAYRLSVLAGSDFWRTGDELVDMIRWLSWSAHHLNRAAGDLYFERVSRPTFTDERAHPSVVEQALRDFQEHAAVLEGELQHRTWLVGNRLSYADFRVATALPFEQAAGLPLQAFPTVRRWHARLMELDAWRAPFEGLMA